MNHPFDDAIEAYSRRTLPHSKIQQIEEHLLVCHDCQDRAAATDEFVSAIRAAAMKRRRMSAKQR